MKQNCKRDSVAEGTAIITWGPGGTSETGTPNSHPADTEHRELNIKI